MTSRKKKEFDFYVNFVIILLGGRRRINYGVFRIESK